MPEKRARKLIATIIAAAVAGMFLPAAVAARQDAPTPPLPPPVQPGQSAPPEPVSPVDRKSEAYYQFTMARMYEEQYELTGRTEFAGRAIASYKRAYELDAHSSVIGERLAEAYSRAGRIPEAIAEAEGVLKQDPANLPSRRILARIYVRSLGDLEAGATQKDIVDQAIA